jgi:hypothetical protein
MLDWLKVISFQHILPQNGYKTLSQFWMGLTILHSNIFAFEKVMKACRHFV